MPKLRIKDIAKLANVSTGTVDRVIHNRGEVSEATRKRVSRILAENDFRPDPLASSLARKRRLRLGVLMPGTVNDHVFWDLPMAGIRRAMKELHSEDLETEIYSFDQCDKSDFEAMANKIPLGELDGLLFAPVFHDESLAFIRQCNEYGLPVVLFNSMLDGARIHCFVGQDAMRSGYVAAKLLHYGLDHRRDLLIVNMSARKDHYAHLIAREQGFRRFFEDHSGRLDHLLTLDLNGEGDDVLSTRLDAILAQYNVGGIFVSNSRVYKLADYLARRGQMGVRLVGYDLLPKSIDFLKRDYIDFLISQRPEEQAFLGLESLFRFAAYGRESKERLMMPIDIIARENLEYYQQL